jgi:hypothetical protein
MPFQLRSVTSLTGRAAALRRHRPAAAGAAARAASTTSQARAVLPSSILMATPRPSSGSAAQCTPSAPTLQNTRSPKCCITRVSKRPVPATMKGARATAWRSRRAARAWSGDRPWPVATRAKASARWRSGTACVGIEQPSVPRALRARSKPVAACSAALTSRITGCSGLT